MTCKQIKEIIYSELSRVYKLCKYIPSDQKYEQWLETLDVKRRIATRAKYNDSLSAYNKLFPYRHWYIQSNHKAEIDSIMQMVLLPEVYKHYLKQYKVFND